MQNYEYLGKPLQIGGLTIRNRFLYGTDWRRADCREQVTEWLKGL